MSTYLQDHPPRVRQFRERGTTPSGVIVVHTAESLPDWMGPDTGAENVAAFIALRTTYGSYHVLCDSDSRIRLVPFDQQAYGDGTGSNPHAIHVSAATAAAKWEAAPAEWRDDVVRQMAEGSATAARWVKRKHGIVVPAKRITRDQSDQRVPGFIPHGDRDPGRRTDPGADFPWDDFLSYFADAMGYDTEPESRQEPRPGNLWDDLIRDARKLRKALPKDATARRQAVSTIIETARPWSVNHKPKD